MNAQTAPTYAEDLCIFELFLDIPHPNASRQNEGTLIIDPPEITCRSLNSEMYKPENVARIARFAFPDHDDSQQGGGTNNIYKKKAGEKEEKGAGLNKSDIYITSFTSSHHTFLIEIQDGIRFYGHVRQYLPAHPCAKNRADLGRRSPRALVLLTRATGGQRFFASILKTTEALYMESNAVPNDLLSDESPARTFLHNLFDHHRRLCLDHSMRVEAGGESLSFTPETYFSKVQQNTNHDQTEISRAFMEQNEYLFKIQLTGVEFQSEKMLSTDQKNSNSEVNGNMVAADNIRFHLPNSLQPGYVAGNIYSYCEDIHSPILPLLRSIGTSHAIRILSALLCQQRVIFISKCITKLSMCIRAASSMLNQGILVWTNIIVPVLPPHLLKYLTLKKPFLVGLLEPFSQILDLIPLEDVISVNLDYNEIRTHNMTNPSRLIPDLLRNVRRSKSPSGGFQASEYLARDLSEILVTDRRVWSQSAEGKPLCLSDKHEQRNLEEERGENNTKHKRGLKSRLITKVGTKVGRMKSLKGDPTQEKISNSSEVSNSHNSEDAAAIFGKIMRSDNDYEEEVNTRGNEHSEEGQDRTKEKLLPAHVDLSTEELILEESTIPPNLTCENEHGEEKIRTALVCFFLHFFGDLGMLLSESKSGTLWLDRKKFLLRRKLLGDTEETPAFWMLAQLTRTIMFEKFVRCRIMELEKSAQDPSNKMMPHHIPLFALAEKHMRKHRLPFTLSNIRRVIHTTVKARPQHFEIDNCERLRSTVIRMTSSQQYTGDRSSDLHFIALECRECNTSLTYVMGVLWTRILEIRGHLWKQPIWALYVLKTLILNGPLTAVTEAMDGIDKIRALRSFTAKHAEQTRQVRANATEVYNMLMHQCQLFLRRRHAAAAKIIKPKQLENIRWADYLVRKFPISVPFPFIHVLLRPSESTPCGIIKERTSFSSGGTADLTPTSNSVNNGVDQNPIGNLISSYESLQTSDHFTETHDKTDDHLTESDESLNQKLNEEIVLKVRSKKSSYAEGQFVNVAEYPSIEAATTKAQHLTDTLSESESSAEDVQRRHSGDTTSGSYDSYESDEYYSDRSEHDDYI